MVSLYFIVYRDVSCISWEQTPLLSEDLPRSTPQSFSHCIGFNPMETASRTNLPVIMDIRASRSLVQDLTWGPFPLGAVN